MGFAGGDLWIRSRLKSILNLACVNFITIVTLRNDSFQEWRKREAATSVCSGFIYLVVWYRDAQADDV